MGVQGIPEGGLAMKLRAKATVAIAIRRQYFRALAVPFMVVWAIGTAHAGGPRGVKDPLVARGQSLFHRAWEPYDARSHGGDGLGPSFNERSCAACHSQGGPGGGGPSSKDVNILTAEKLSEAADPAERRDALRKLHAGLGDARSVVVHRFGTDPEHENWRNSLMEATGAPGFFTIRSIGRGAVPGVSLAWSRRNTPALFGLGLVDRLPDEVLEAVARRSYPGFPEVTGRLSRLPDGRIGRFGWKAQLPTLEDFVLTACAGELGLEVPGHPQAGDSRNWHYEARGLDMNQAECDAMVAFVRQLPAPIEVSPAGSSQKDSVSRGRLVFEKIGCAACHLPRLGDVDGIYSDLLLHEMGNELSDSGVYYGDSSQPPGQLASRAEWRTPPLWGIRVSGPYLHDGRAKTMVSAVVMHGGEGVGSANLFRALQTSDRKDLIHFLLSLAPPRPGADSRRQTHVVRISAASRDTR